MRIHQSQSVYHMWLNAVKIGAHIEKTLLPVDIQTGVYRIHLFVNNQSVVHKLMIQQ